VTNAVRDADGGFIVELDRFQGPLDLLLHLIREQDVDIFDIPIARITEQFLRAISGVERLGLDRAGEFLELAATLIRIKAQMLLPRRSEGGEADDPRADLVRRLLEYEHFRDASRRLEDAEADRSRHYGRGWVPPRAERPAERPLELAWEDLWAAVLAVEAAAARAPVDHIVAHRSVPLEDKVALILDTLAHRARVEFRRLVAPYGDRLHAVVTLLAGLELSRQRRLALRQREAFSALWLYRRNGQDDADEADR
jgi:segregation and condensation protein A